MKKPVIGINANIVQDGKYNKLASDYINAVWESGGIPFILPITPTDKITLEQVLLRIDGLLLSGGNDLSPLRYNEEPLTGKIKLLPGNKERFDMELTRMVLHKNIPVLGICYGMQLINVALGGSLFQDIRSQIGTPVNHKNTNHKVYLSEGSILHNIIGKKSIITNSSHHQSVKITGKGLMINARSEDGIIEGIEIPDRFCLGIQWHPERLLNKKEQLRLFQVFIKSTR